MGSACLQSPVQIDQQQIAANNVHISNKKKNKLVEKKRKPIQCHICLAMAKAQDQIDLNCSHVFHKQCLLQTYKVNIDERNSQLKCPDCYTAVQYNILSKILDEKLFARYDKILIQNALILDDQIFFCPTADCPAIYQIIPSEFRYFDCRLCKVQFCLVCHKKYHGKSQCILDNDREYFQSSGCCKVCPQCNRPWFKKTGCNSVQCKVCKISFCYDCNGFTCGHSCKNKK